MDLLIYQIRAAYRENPTQTILFLVLSTVVGIIFGFGVLGPALFG
jgi:hypothetical protein